MRPARHGSSGRRELLGPVDDPHETEQLVLDAVERRIDPSVFEYARSAYPSMRSLGAARPRTGSPIGRQVAGGGVEPSASQPCRCELRARSAPRTKLRRRNAGGADLTGEQIGDHAARVATRHARDRRARCRRSSEPIPAVEDTAPIALRSRRQLADGRRPAGSPRRRSRGCSGAPRRSPPPRRPGLRPPRWSGRSDHAGRPASRPSPSTFSTTAMARSPTCWRSVLGRLPDLGVDVGPGPSQRTVVLLLGLLAPLRPHLLGQPVGLVDHGPSLGPGLADGPLVLLFGLGRPPLGLLASASAWRMVAWRSSIALVMYGRMYLAEDATARRGTPPARRRTWRSVPGSSMRPASHRLSPWRGRKRTGRRRPG